MWLLIDDVRDLNTDVIARNSAAGMKMLALGGWECVCFDHDLAEEKTGYDVLVWAIENNFYREWFSLLLVVQLAAAICGPR